jgi:hypothetical protein
MLASVLALLTNLKAITCYMQHNSLARLFVVLEKSHPKLQSLVIVYAFPLRISTSHSDFSGRSAGLTPPLLPKFRLLRRFAYNGPFIDNSPDFQELLSAQTVELHAIITYRGIGHYSSLFFLSTSDLRKLHLDLLIPDGDFVSQILSSSYQLEDLRLKDTLELSCVLSTVFCAHARLNSFLALRVFSFLLHDVKDGYADADLPCCGRVCTGGSRAYYVVYITSARPEYSWVQLDGLGCAPLGHQPANVQDLCVGELAIGALRYCLSHAVWSLLSWSPRPLPIHYLLFQMYMYLALRSAF